LLLSNQDYIINPFNLLNSVTYWKFPTVCFCYFYLEKKIQLIVTIYRFFFVHISKTSRVYEMFIIFTVKNRPKYTYYLFLLQCKSYLNIDHYTPAFAIFYRTIQIFYRTKHFYISNISDPIIRINSF
jgi:hypothetical protein